MTTNQTIDGVPGLRELLERVATEANHMLGFTYAANYDECRNAVDELRALLDAPACPDCKVCVGSPLLPKGCTIDNGQHDPAAQHQGVPVAELQVAFFEGGPKATINWFTPSAFEPGATKLYAEQPAPVAVVLPDCEYYTQYMLGVIPNNAVEVNARKDGWNACLDELKRLNPSLQPLPLQSQPL